MCPVYLQPISPVCTGANPPPKARKHPNAPGGKTPTPPFPKRGAGGAAPTGGTRGSPLYPKTLEGVPGGTTASVSISLLSLSPLPEAGWQAAPNAPRQKRRRLRSQAGCRGRSPHRGYRGSPPVLENVGGRSGRDSGAGQARPSAEGGAGYTRQPSPPPPTPSCIIRTIVL